jgi:PAS domain S-box-containing protein
MTLKIGHKVLVMLLVSMALVVSLGYAAFSFVGNLIKASQWSAHSQHVLFFTERMRTTYAEMKMAGLIHSIRNDSVTFRRYMARRQQLDADRVTLDSLIRDNAGQRARVAALATFLSSPDTLSGVPLREMPASQLIYEIQDEETKLRRERQASITEQFYNFITVSVILLAVWLITMAVLLVVLSRNLKARDRAESRLSVAASEIFQLYDNAPCGYFTLNGDGMIVKINGTLLGWLGLTSTGVTDRLHLLDMTSPGNREALKEGILSFNSPSGTVEADLLRKEGELMPALINYSKTKDTKGNPAYLCSVVNYTDQKKAEEEIRRANKELEAFSYSVSHDLRAPLRSVNGYGQILMEDYGDKIDDEGKRLIGVIINNGKRMGQLIDDLLDFSRASRKEIMQSLIIMDDFVREIASELSEREMDRKISLSIENLESIHGDSSMLRQVWVNLIGNALKYSRKREEAVIQIGSTTKANEVVYFVKDNGAGFSMDYYEKLFGVFQRLHKWQDFEGTGVGLALVKRIVERHGGKIWAESALDQGATFYFSIPTQKTTHQNNGAAPEPVEHHQ